MKNFVYCLHTASFEDDLEMHIFTFIDDKKNTVATIEIPGKLYYQPQDVEAKFYKKYSNYEIRNGVKF